MKDSRIIIKNLMNGDNFIKHEIKLRKFEFGCYLRGLRQLKETHKVKFVLLAQWRTGSTLLENFLDSHPEITCDTEIYNKHVGFGVSPKRYIFFPKLMLKGRKSNFDTKSYGFNLKLIQVKNFLPFNLYSTRKFINYLYSSSWKIIYLSRQNKLDQALSFIIATKRNFWHTWQKKEPVEKIYIDYKDLMFHLELNEKISREEQKILKEIPHMKIIYEDNLLNSENHQETCNSVFSFLGLGSHSVKAKSQRILTREKHENLIINYKELMQKIRETKFNIYI